MEATSSKYFWSGGCRKVENREKRKEDHDSEKLMYMKILIIVAKYLIVVSI